MGIFSKVREAIGSFISGGRSKSTLHFAQRQVMTVRGARRVPSLAQWRELPRYLSPGEKRIFTAAVCGIVLALGLLGFRFLSSHQTVVAATGGDYTEGLVGSPQFLNPLYSVASDTDSDLSRLIFSGLMRWDANQGLVTDLAESYTVSEDQKVYTFTLRTDAKWHNDGSLVVAEDVVFTYQAIQNPEYHSPLAVSFSGMTVEAQDDRTVVFTLAEPFAPFLSTLTVGILPSSYWENVPPQSAQLTRKNLEAIGSGPYKVHKITMDQTTGSVKSITLVRNADFYRGAPYIQELTFKFYPDSTSLLTALRDKNVEGAGFVPSEEVTKLAEDRSLQLVSPALPQFTAVFLNSRHAALLAEDNIRAGLILATDRQAIVDSALAGQGKVVTSPILPSMPGYDATVGATAYDLAGAQKLFDELGYTLAEGATVRTKGDTKLAFTLTTVNTPELVAVAEKLKEQWLLAGVELTVNVVDTTSLQNGVLKERNYDMLLTGELYSADPDAYPFWHSSQVAYPGLNLSQFSNRKADEAIETARSTTDPAKRAEAYASLAKLIDEEDPAVFLYQPTYTYITTPKIKNIVLPTITVPADRFSTITEWYIATRRVFNSPAKQEETTGDTQPSATDEGTPAPAEAPATTENATEPAS